MPEINQRCPIVHPQIFGCYIYYNFKRKPIERCLTNKGFISGFFTGFLEREMNFTNGYCSNRRNIIDMITKVGYIHESKKDLFSDTQVKYVAKELLYDIIA
jgi:hypothetical protein